MPFPERFKNPFGGFFCLPECLPCGFYRLLIRRSCAGLHSGVFPSDGTFLLPAGKRVAGENRLPDLLNRFLRRKIYPRLVYCFSLVSRLSQFVSAVCVLSLLQSDVRSLFAVQHSGNRRIVVLIGFGDSLPDFRTHLIGHRFDVPQLGRRFRLLLFKSDTGLLPLFSLFYSFHRI